MLRELMVVKDQQIEELSASRPLPGDGRTSQTDVEALRRKLELTELELLKRKREQKNVAMSRVGLRSVVWWALAVAVSRQLFCFLCVAWCCSCLIVVSRAHTRARTPQQHQ
jgi:hypothetical protein